MPITCPRWTEVHPCGQTQAQVDAPHGREVGTVRAILGVIVSLRPTDILRSVGCVGLGCVLGVGSGCDPSAPDDPEEEIGQSVATMRSSSTLAATANFALVAQNFRADLSDMDVPHTEPEAVRGAILFRLLLRLDALYGLFSCERQITTLEANESYRIGFNGCALGYLELSGSLDATLTVESDPQSGLATAVTWVVDASDFEASTPQRDLRPRFRGPVSLTTSLVRDEPMRWAMLPGHTIELPAGLFAAESSASWLVDDDDCVTMDLDARLTLLEPADDLDREVGDIALAAKDVHRCRAECPSAGEVTLTYGAGSILRWTYNEGGEVDVIGPRGRLFTATLPCAE